MARRDWSRCSRTKARTWLVQKNEVLAFSEAPEREGAPAPAGAAAQAESPQMKWLYLAVAILAEIVATSALKSSDGFTRLLPSVVTTLGYVCRSISCR